MKTKIKTVVFLILFIINALITTLISALFLYQQYGSVDARYARDNLEFLSSQLSEAYPSLPLERTHGLYAIRYPEAIAIKHLRTLSNLWVDSYLSALLEFDNVTKLDQLKPSPNDILSRLVLQANDERIQAVYYEIQLNAALTNPDSYELLHSSLLEVQSASQEYIISAQGALDELLSDFSLCIILIIFFSMLSIFWLKKFLRHKNKLHASA